jgi:hypothetical protein
MKKLAHRVFDRHQCLLELNDFDKLLKNKGYSTRTRISPLFQDPNGFVLFQQVMQTGCPGSLLEGHVQISAQPVEELHNSTGLGLDDNSITILPIEFVTAIEILSVCTSMPIYLTLVIIGCSFLKKCEQGTRNVLQRGALL